MITVEFDRAKMRHSVAKLLVTFFGAIVLAALVGSLLQPHIPATRWLNWLSTALMGLAVGQVMVLVEPMAVLGYGLKKKVPAIVIDHNGVEDNASQFAFGQLTWDQIEKMYPSEQKFRLFARRWTRMPIIFRQRGLVIMLKESADLRPLLENKPRSGRWIAREWYQPGKRRWLFVPEAVLPMSAKDLMTQLNKFYLAEVRG